MSTRTVVIGSGFGGLAAALRLRARGEDVTLVERQSQIGGRATSYEADGYVFDAGPTVITAPFLLEELFGLFDREMEDYVELTPLDPWYRIRFDDGSSFDYGPSLDKTLAQIREIEPADVDGYMRFLRKTEDIYRVGFEELGDVPFLDMRSMLRALPKILKLEGYRSVHGRASRYLKSDKLRRVFSFQPLLVGGNPMTTTSIYSLIHVLERRFGVHFAMGGTRAIVRGLGRLLEEVGVEVVLDATVERIDVDEGRASGVRLADGRRIAADRVVANADPPFVYDKMIDARHRRRWTSARLDRLRYSMGLFVLYFGARKTYPDLAHHEILLGPRYGSLLRDIFEGAKLPADPSLYLHAPTRTDSSLAPEGSESMYALAPVPNTQAGIDWEREGPAFRDRVLDEIETRVCPGLRESLDVAFHVTPEHFRDTLLSRHGAGFSIQPLLTQSAYFRFHNRSEDVRGLYFVGAGTQPGAGLPGVLSSARALDRILDHEEANGRATSVTVERTVEADVETATIPRDSAAKILARRGKTFAWANRLMPRTVRDDIATLYAFCRIADDLADSRSDDDAALRALDELDADVARGSSEHPLVADFLELAGRRGIPLSLAQELIAGVRSDVGTVRVRTTDDLVRYCYRVASTVGVMICHVLDVRDRDAWPFAVDLGIAMQLTNIARDVLEDAEDGRVYLPGDRIPATRVHAALSGQPSSEKELFEAVTWLLDLADRYYRSADRGMRFLPLFARWPILTASRSYEAIGAEIRKAGVGYWRERVYTSRRTKISETARSAASVVFDPRFRGRSGPYHERRLHGALARLRSARDLGIAP